VALKTLKDGKKTFPEGGSGRGPLQMQHNPNSLNVKGLFYNGPPMRLVALLVCARTGLGACCDTKSAAANFKEDP
jgi:hypothetical protein